MRIIIILIVLLASSTAFGADYGVCANNIAQEAGALIAPVVPAEKTMVVTEEVAIIVVKGNDLGDSAHEVLKKYETELYAALSSPSGVWVGVVEGIDGSGDPALWLHGYIATAEGCVTGTIFERVYAERANAPTAFWKQVREWEDAHPEADRLIHTP